MGGCHSAHRVDEPHDVIESADAGADAVVPPRAAVAVSTSLSADDRQSAASRQRYAHRVARKTIFADILSESELNRLARLFVHETFAVSQVIFHSKTVADKLYIVCRGRVALKIQQRRGDDAPAASIVSCSVSAKPRSFARTMTGLNSPSKRSKFPAPAIRIPEIQEQTQTSETPTLQASVSARGSDSLRTPPAAAVTPLASSARNRRPRQSLSFANDDDGFATLLVTSPSAGNREVREASLSPVSAHNAVFNVGSVISSIRPTTQQHRRTRTTGSTAAAQSEPTAGEGAPSVELSPTNLKNGGLLTHKRRYEMFGVESLRTDSETVRRTMKATAETKSECFTLSKAAFTSFLGGITDSALVKRLRDIAGESIESSLKQMNLFSALSPSSLSVLSGLLTWLQLEADSVLFCEGQIDRSEGNALYFLYSGTVSVEMTDERGIKQPPKILHSGVCFGELGLFIDIPRTATVRSHNGKCVLLVLHHRTFHSFLYWTPSLWNKFMSQLEQYTVNVGYLLQNEAIQKAFTQFCQTEFSSENIEFWLAAKLFRTNKFRSNRERQVRAQELVKLYILESSPKQVNLKGHIQHRIISRVLGSHYVDSRVSSKDHSAQTVTRQRRVSTYSSSPAASPPQWDKADANSSAPALSDVFVDAECEILSLMSTDSFSRFKTSNSFKQTLREMNSAKVAAMSSEPVADDADGSSHSVSSVASVDAAGAAVVLPNAVITSADDE